MVATLRSSLLQSSLRSCRRLPLADTLQTSTHLSNRPIYKFYSVSSSQQRLQPAATSNIFPANQTEHRSPSSPLPRTASRVAPLPSNRPFTTTTTTRKMGSDEDYMAFLNKANEDPSKGSAEAAAAANKSQDTTTAAPFRATQQGVEVPEVLRKVCGRGEAFYVSDADEPFEAVALGWDEAGKGLPDEEEFAGLIGHWDPKNAEVEILDPVDWDRSGQYKEIIDAVREAGQGNDVRVYRVERGGVRVEYWVVTTEGKGEGAKLVGAKALAIES